MKKVALTLASVIAAAAFAPEASAVPAFARQTGMACSACHYQHFPLLNGFGRAFKSAAFTMMGSQGKVEGDNEGVKVDIPDRVNLAVFNTAVVEQQSGTDNRAQIKTPSTGGEFSLFMGGRGSENVGFIAEAGLGGNAGAASTTGVVGATKILAMYPVGDARMGLSVHSSNGQGVAYSFETLNTGAVNTHKLMGNNGAGGAHVNAYSAANYLGTATAATGASFVAASSMGFVNVGLWEKAGNGVVDNAKSLNLNYVRAAYTADIAGFDMGFGVQRWGGTTTVLNQTADATVIDFQAQAESLGIYASYGTAAASGTTGVGATNMFNSNTANAKTSLNVAATWEFMHGTTLQGAVRVGKQGAGLSDNAVMIGATYDLAQNLALGLNYTTQSGDFWSAANNGGTEPNGKNVTTLLFEAMF